MLKGIYANAQAMTALMAKQDVQSNNLANVNTTGFKKDRVNFEEFQEVLRGQIVSSPIARTSTESDQGTLVRTENPLDMAIQGNGYFMMETPEGPRYTRAGSFQWDAKGRLTDAEGRAVLGTGGPIQKSPEGGPVRIGANGKVTMGPNEIGQLNIVGFTSEARLKKVGHGLYEAVGGEPKAAAGQVVQGFLESSSVNSVQEMADMINTLRLFEANQRSLRFQDEALGRAIQELGR
jgi:flagellar basal-body rod protein FlgF